MGDDQKQRLADMAYDQMMGSHEFRNMSMDAQGELIVAMVDEVESVLTTKWEKIDII